MKRMGQGLLLCLVIILLLSVSSLVSAAGPGLMLDGKFGDWQGKTHISAKDGAGTAFRSVSWGTSLNDKRLYFMIERESAASPAAILDCRVYLDINNNGSYMDSIDKYIEVAYRPDQKNEQQVAAQVFSTSGIIISAYNGQWGESSGQGGSKFEFAIPMEDLDIFPGQPIRFYLSGIGAAAYRLPIEGDIMWSPFPVIVQSRPVIIAVIVLWALLTILFWHHRIWVLYYILGSVGFIFLAILLLRGSFFEFKMEQQAGLILHYILGYLGINTTIFDKSPGTLLVLIELDQSWTTIDIDIESSGLLEMTIFLGLLLFYPAYTITKKIAFSLAGVIALYLINLLQILVIIAVIHWGGRQLIYVAHTIIGRIIFFILVISLYWRVFTMPSLRRTKERVENG